MSFLERITRPIPLGWMDLVAILVLAATWATEVRLRPTLIRPHCAETPALCSPSSLPWVDQWNIGVQIPAADTRSFDTQYLSAAWAIAAPTAIWLSRAALRLASPGLAAVEWSADFVILLQTTLLNGVLTETTRLLAQRPRPFVIPDPTGLGRDPSNYTSFYSGHTSFSAAIGTAGLIRLLVRAAPAWGIAVFTGLASMLVFLTGLFRVLAGRHFTTDVLTASVMGTAAALLLVWLRSRGASGQRPNSRVKVAELA